MTPEEIDSEPVGGVLRVAGAEVAIRYRPGADMKRRWLVSIGEGSGRQVQASGQTMGEAFGSAWDEWSKTE